MFAINEDLSIHATRGDIVFFLVSAVDEADNNAQYIFKQGDVVRINVHGKRACDNIVLQKDFLVNVETEKVEIFLTEDDTKFEGVINKPTDYWYEICLNPDTNPQTIIGYDENGPKVFRIYPEGEGRE